MEAQSDATPSPTLADQVSRLYDLIAGYHATHLLEIARELGVWEALAHEPGMTSEDARHAARRRTRSTPTCCAAPRSSSGCWSGMAPGGEWRRTSTRSWATPTSSFYLARAPRMHMVLGEDYRRLRRPFRAGHDQALPGPRRGVHARGRRGARRRCRGSSSTSCCRDCPDLQRRLEDGARVLDVGCGGGWAVVQIAERFPRTHMRRDRHRALLGRAGAAADRRARPGGSLRGPPARASTSSARTAPTTWPPASSSSTRSPRPQAGSVRGGRAGAEARRLLPDLRRGLSGDRRRRCRRCRPASPRWRSGTS